MGAHSEIQWTWTWNQDGTVKMKGRTWNVVGGCSEYSPGCDNCYARKLHDQRHKAYKEGAKLPKQYAVPFDEIQLFRDRLPEALRWTQPCRVFVNSMSDTFHKKVPTSYIAALWAYMAMAKDFTFLVLTKRIDRAERVLNDEAFRRDVADNILRLRPNDKVKWDELAQDVASGKAWPLINVQVGTSVENQKMLDLRAPMLSRVNAHTRFLSIEPLIGPVKLGGHLSCGPHGIIGCKQCAANRAHNKRGSFDRLARACGPLIHQVIVGGESGPRARPLPETGGPEDIRDEALAAGVAFFYKQNGGVNKKATGRLLDGVEYNQYPEDVGL